MALFFFVPFFQKPRHRTADNARRVIVRGKRPNGDVRRDFVSAIEVSESVLCTLHQNH